MVWRVLFVTMLILQVSRIDASDLKTSKIQIIPHVEKTSKVSSKDSKQNNRPSKAVPLTVELALAPTEQEKGLMFRKSLEPGKGMLFVFSNERPRQFWMKNTLIPLSIAFIDEKKTIFQISDLKPVNTLLQKEYDRAESVKPAKYVLEVPQGWFLVNKIQEGSKMVWPDESKFALP